MSKGLSVFVISLSALLFFSSYLSAQQPCGLYPYTKLEDFSSANQVCDDDPENEDCYNPQMAIFKKCIGTVFYKECTHNQTFQIQCGPACWETYPQSDQECLPPGGGGGGPASCQQRRRGLEPGR